MHVRLPIQEKRPLPTAPAELVRALETLLAEKKTANGYVFAAADGVDWLLFCHQGLTWCAGSIEEDRLLEREVGEFLAALPGASSVEYRVTDLPLFLCTAVLFRKAPSAQIPTELLDGDTLLEHVKQTGKDAVIVIRRGEARSLAFCREGRPAALYPADGEEVPPADDLAERILTYVYTDDHYKEITLDLYDEVALPPADDARKKPTEYALDARPSAARPELALVVKLGDRTVFHYPMRSDRITVGRGVDNDLQLDNLSVSRRHAVLTLTDDGTLAVQDQGSHNGLSIGGKKVGEARLHPGEAVGIGKYHIQYPAHAPAAGDRVAPPERRADAATAREPTMALPSQKERPPQLLAENGDAHTVRGLVYTIGKQTGADLRIRGLFVAPVHVRIRRTPEGDYRAEHVAGRRKVLHNGRPVKEAKLADGDWIEVGGNRFRFTKG